MAQNSNNLSKVVAQLTKSLSPRNKDIISRRFGLKNGKKETLESIGKSYGITRERVRQIEDFSINQLTKIVDSIPEVASYVSMAKDIINENGGVMKESELFEKFSGSAKENVANTSLMFVLTLAGSPVRYSESDAFHPFWAVDHETQKSFSGAVASLISLMDKSRTIITNDEFPVYAKTISAPDMNINTILSISKQISRNVFGQIGLASWAEVKPKGVRDKAYLVLKREKNPKHFTEIAKLINSTGFSQKKANIQTVHNELIKDNRFILVGRGMYGLSEWGYRPGTVKDVLVDVIKSSSKSLTKAELISKVMNARMVKENTILLNLQDSKVFTKKEDGTYSLKKA